MNVKLKPNSALNFKKAALIGSGFFFIVSCQTYPDLQNKQLSLVDSTYRLNRLDSSMQKSESTSILLYRNVVASTLATNCKWFPSDSVYTQVSQNKCGVVRGTLIGFARFMTEEDAAQMGFSIVNNKNHLTFMSLPDDCAL